MGLFIIDSYPAGYLISIAYCLFFFIVFVIMCRERKKQHYLIIILFTSTSLLFEASDWMVPCLSAYMYMYSFSYFDVFNRYDLVLSFAIT